METASDLINTINNFSQNLNSPAESEAEDAVREISGASLKHGDVRIAGDDNSTEMFDPENNTYVGSKSGKKSRSQQEIEAMSDDDFLSALAFGGSDIFDDADIIKTPMPRQLYHIQLAQLQLLPAHLLAA